MNKQTKRPTRRDAVSAAQTRSSDFNPDYSYVKKDLRRIGTLAGTFMVILIVLSFFLR
jgi:hypothetical protein